MGIGEFVLTHKNVKIPEAGKVYSINEGYAEEWDDAVKAYVSMCKKPMDKTPAKKIKIQWMYGAGCASLSDPRWCVFISGHQEESKWKVESTMRVQSIGIHRQSCWRTSIEW